MRHKYKGRFAKYLTLEWFKTSHRLLLIGGVVSQCT
uniref:Uncharacterized protein n=1 Tax=virus sp. ctBS918 TaxID=2825807 RepID=A0A8S5RNR1_9VIRU|nr:MAG TPA: hypothetical protein [virus sp. ctBS918]